jgi:RNA polymerase sigma-70 factor (ECF subfamily)
MTPLWSKPEASGVRREREEMPLTLAYSVAESPGPQSGGDVDHRAPTLTDGQLIQRVGAGDAGAFELLYRRYARPVFALALRRLGDRGRAEDAVQETFASVWRSASSYRRERGPGAPWLYAVARNAIVDRRRALGPPPAESTDEASGEPGPDERAEASWISWRVHRSLAELPDQERKLIELAYWGGLSQSEIADFVGIPLGTVKTRTRSALSRLADALEGELS